MIAIVIPEPDLRELHSPFAGMSGIQVYKLLEQDVSKGRTACPE